MTTTRMIRRTFIKSLSVLALPVTGLVKLVRPKGEITIHSGLMPDLDEMKPGRKLATLTFTESPFDWKEPRKDEELPK